MNQIFVVLIEVCTHGLRILTGFLVNLRRNHDTTPLPRCRCCSGSKVFLPRLLAKLIPLKKLLNRYLLHKVQMISTRKYPLRRYLLDPPGQRKRITHKENITLSGPWQTMEPKWPKCYMLGYGCYVMDVHTFGLGWPNQTSIFEDPQHSVL